MFDMLLQFLDLRLLDLFFSCCPIAGFLQKHHTSQNLVIRVEIRNLKLRFEVDVFSFELFTFRQCLSEFLCHLILCSLRCLQIFLELYDLLGRLAIC